MKIFEALCTKTQSEENIRTWISHVYYYGWETDTTHIKKIICKPTSGKLCVYFKCVVQCKYMVGIRGLFGFDGSEWMNMTMTYSVV